MTTAAPPPPASPTPYAATNPATVLPPVINAAPSPVKPDRISLLIRHGRYVAWYGIIALILTPFTYRLAFIVTDTFSSMIPERERMVAGPIRLSPIAYFTRLTRIENVSFTVINADDRVKAVPEVIGDVPSLETINIYHNPITALPDSLGRLPALNKLLVQNTKLRTLPRTMGQNTALVDLSLQGNHLRVLPDIFGSLTNLEVLNLAYNDLSELPPSVANLKKTILLDLTGNKLRTVPRYLPPNLEVLFLGGNPIPLKELEQLQLRNALNDTIIYF